jgi:hypothetical protein
MAVGTAYEGYGSLQMSLDGVFLTTSLKTNQRPLNTGRQLLIIDRDFFSLRLSSVLPVIHKMATSMNMIDFNQEYSINPERYPDNHTSEPPRGKPRGIL